MSDHEEYWIELNVAKKDMELFKDCLEDTSERAQYDVEEEDYVVFNDVFHGTGQMVEELAFMDRCPPFAYTRGGTGNTNRYRGVRMKGSEVYEVQCNTDDLPVCACTEDGPVPEEFEEATKFFKAYRQFELYLEMRG